MYGYLNRMDDIKLVKITYWNTMGVKPTEDQRIVGEMK
jgi:hypothetical protein